MQLYHHPYSLDSQKVRLALEEKGIDYTSYHVNPLSGKNMDSKFFQMNPSGKLPVFQNGSHIIFETLEIIRESLNCVSGEAIAANTVNVTKWMEKIESWNPKMFTLSHIPERYRLFVSKFVRRVVIARMAESPDLASVYHAKLRGAYETEEKLKDQEIIRLSEEKLLGLLDEAETQLRETTYLAGEEFTLVDVMFIPILSRLSLLNLEDEYITELYMKDLKDNTRIAWAYSLFLVFSLERE
ncbi:Glutathione S-transferase TCHQD [Acorus calamus]|uniref:Glutathione S-transferase TCHQD n=1 Tax=Acorus calamus TaxID=4465 RepID=A0AAV9D1A9_ACOCL|nr:Glutathione S-transferase TCHQD [Acorus calamus]